MNAGCAAPLHEALFQAGDAAAEAERLYEVRCRAGAVPLRIWLDAQDQALGRS